MYSMPIHDFTVKSLQRDNAVDDNTVDSMSFAHFPNIVAAVSCYLFPIFF